MPEHYTLGIVALGSCYLVHVLAAPVRCLFGTRLARRTERHLAAEI